MATDTPIESTSPLLAETTPADAAPPSEAAVAQGLGAEEPVESAQPAPGQPPLPPRVDPGQNADEVLGEVSKLFGQATGGGASRPLRPHRRRT